MDDTKTVEIAVQKYLLKLRPNVKLTSSTYMRTHSVLVELLVSAQETPDVAIRIAAAKLGTSLASIKQSIKKFFENVWYLPKESRISLTKIIGTSIHESDSPTPPPINTFLSGSVEYLAALHKEPPAMARSTKKKMS